MIIFISVLTVYYVSKEKQVKAESELDVVGVIPGTLTEAENGGLYCAESNSCCAVIHSDGVICWLVPCFGSNQGDYPSKIAITFSQIESIKSGAVFYQPSTNN